MSRLHRGTPMNENHRGPLLALILSFSQREKGHEESLSS